jgi:DNA-binding SARP family transcriptional activator
MARVSVQLMGTFRVMLDGDPVAGFVSDKVRALLAYLAVEGGQPQRREFLAGLLWGDYPERSARASLRNALANLRQVIGDHDAQPPYLRITPQAIQLHPEGDVWVDVIAFTQLVDGTGDRQMHREQRTDQLEAAVSLYQGSFLEGFSVADSAAFEEWALLVREQLQRRMLVALQALVEQYERRGDLERALEYARREVELEPYPEAAQRQLMRLLALNGQRELALAQYERHCRLLATDLGVTPGQETVRLYEGIRDKEDLTGLGYLSPDFCAKIGG